MARISQEAVPALRSEFKLPQRVNGGLQKRRCVMSARFQIEIALPSRAITQFTPEDILRKLIAQMAKLDLRSQALNRGHVSRIV